MSAPLIWIALPLLLGVLSLLLRKYGSLLMIGLLGISLILTWLAWQFPIDQAFELASVTFKISSGITILGRGLNIYESDRFLIAFVFFANSLWLLGALMVRPGKLFPGISQIVIALIVAALSVDPFLYAAIFIALMVLISVPILSSPSAKVKNGILRYLNFQLFGVPFILFVGWLLAGVEASPGNSALVLRAGILLVLGFAFLLALFPFHSWIPMLAEETHPYSFAFIMFFLPLFVSVFALGFFERFAWLRDLPALGPTLVVIGGIVSALGGMWALIQTTLSRQLGFALVLDTGLILVSIGISGTIGIEIFFALAIVRLFSLIAWAIALSGLREASGGSLQIFAVSRITSRHPFLLAGLLIAVANFAGLPLMLSFIPKFSLLEEAWKISEIATWGIIIGQLSLSLMFFRLLIALGTSLFSTPTLQTEDSLLGKTKDPLLPDSSNLSTWGFLLIVVFILVISSLFPQYLFNGITSMLSSFSQITQ